MRFLTHCNHFIQDYHGYGSPSILSFCVMSIWKITKAIWIIIIIIIINDRLQPDQYIILTTTTPRIKIEDGEDEVVSRLFQSCGNDNKQ